MDRPADFPLHKPARHSFVTLDGLRGVAAAMTFLRHFGDPIVNAHFHGVYLAVDMFFALSGFVLTHSYQDRLGRTIGLRQFAIARLIRFYPLYALGTVIGIGWYLWSGPPADGHNATVSTMAWAAVLGLLFLPVPPGLAFDRRQNLYPYNFSAWSLLMEYAVNVALPAVIPWLTNRRLAVLLVGFYGALALVAAKLHGIDTGWGYGWLGHPPLGLIRASASFLAGIAIYRLWASGRWRPRVPFWVTPLLLLVFFISTEGGGRWRAMYDLSAAMILFPALILLAASSEPGPRWHAVMRTLGLASYPLYAIHSLMSEIVWKALPGLFGSDRLSLTRVVADGIMFLLLVGLAVLLDRVFDRPVRKALTGWVERRRHKRQMLDTARPL